MLRIRKEYDLKNLEQFGFQMFGKGFWYERYEKYTYTTQNDYDEGRIEINTSDRVIRFVQQDFEDFKHLDTLYDLINTYIDLDNKQVSIVERVDE